MAKRLLLTAADYARPEMVTVATEAKLQLALDAVRESVKLSLAQNDTRYWLSKLNDLEAKRRVDEAIWDEFVMRVRNGPIS